MLTEAVRQPLGKDLHAGKALLGDYVEAANGFEHLARLHGIAIKRPRHVLEPDVDTDAGELLGILTAIQKTTEISLTVGTGR